MLFDELQAALSAREPRLLPEPPKGVRAASVLAPLCDHPGEPTLLFVRRPDGDFHHAGQIAFPGGSRDPGDRDALHTALREAEEEVGIRPQDVTLLGRLDDYDTVVTRFRVSPFVGLLPAPYPFKPDPREVASLLEIPLRILLAPSIHSTVLWGRFTVHSYMVDRDRIWGATGAMLTQLLDLVRGLPSCPQP